MRNLLPPILAILILVAAAGCGQQEHATEQSENASGSGAPISTWPATLQTDRGNFAVTVQPSDGAIERNKHFSMAISIDPGSADDAPLKVTADADMPAHRHGMNTRPEVTKEDDLRYRVDGMLFHMAGEWVITVDVTQGTESEHASFPVLVE
jgi:hypothetical protein